jgi:hypothetical protein
MEHMMSRLIWVVAALVACGDSNGVKHIVDAPPTSGGSDAAIDAGSNLATGSASVTVTVAGTGELGLTTYFQSADSTLNTTATTDSTGTASGIVGTGGFVTVIIPGANGGPDTLVTWSLVNAGDHLLLAEAGAETTMTFTIPTISPYTTYHVATTCGTATLAVQAAAEFPAQVTGGSDTFADCAGPQDIEVVAIDGNMQAQQSFFVAGQTMTSATTLSLVGNTYVPAVQRTYTWNDDADGTLDMIDALRSPLGQTYASPALAVAGTLTRNAPAFGTQTDVVEGSVTVGSTVHQMFEWGQGASYVGDWGAARLGDFGAAPTFAPATAQLSWATTGGSAQPNVAIGEVAVMRTSDSHQWQWLVLGGGTSLQLPTLPTTLYNWNIAATDTTTGPSIRLVDVPGDPGAARANYLGPTPAVAIETGATGVMSAAVYRTDMNQAVARLRLPFSRR